MLPSTPIGDTRPVIAYNVYDETNTESPLKLTASPIAEPKFIDSRIVFGQKRCYTVRTAQTIGGFTIESDAPPPQCELLVVQAPAMSLRFDATPIPAVPPM